MIRKKKVHEYSSKVKVSICHYMNMFAEYKLAR